MSGTILTLNLQNTVARPQEEGLFKRLDRFCQEKPARALLAVGLTGIIVSQIIDARMAHYVLENQLKSEGVNCVSKEQYDLLETTAPHPYHFLARRYISLFECD